MPAVKAIYTLNQALDNSTIISILLSKANLFFLIICKTYITRRKIAIATTLANDLACQFMPIVYTCLFWASNVYRKSPLPELG
jgi:hypothetical protein